MWGKSGEMCILCRSSVIYLRSRLILLPYRLIIVRDAQQLFSSREDEALLQGYNLSYFHYPPAGGCAAGGGITPPNPAPADPCRSYWALMREMNESGSVNGSWGQVAMSKTGEVNKRLCDVFWLQMFLFDYPEWKESNVRMNSFIP